VTWTSTKTQASRAPGEPRLPSASHRLSVDLAKFYSAEQIARAKAGQRDYAKFLADRQI